jgi:glutaminyl-tRNA synthetase
MSDAPPPETTTVSNALNARELAWAKNSPELEAEHARINGPIIRTRFPPEPNGFLHIGHAKSMNMNFSLAFEKLGVPPEHRRTVFRYDDTNPAAEELEYIDSLRRDLEWLGWEPERTTYSSDNFRQLYEFAVQLIRRGLAYVCDMSKAEMEVQRDLARRRAMCRATGRDPDVEAPIPSPDILPGRNRDTSVERNLEMFENMVSFVFGGIMLCVIFVAMSCVLWLYWHWHATRMYVNASQSNSGAQAPFPQY